MFSPSILFLFAAQFLVSVQGQAASAAPVSGAITTPPSQCSRQCSSFSLSSCAVKQVPTSNAQWATTCNSMATCICPLLSSSTACHDCLIANPDTTSASTYWGNLGTFCSQGTAGPQICMLFNVTVSANIAGATNVTTTASTLMPAPTATGKKSAATTASSSSTAFAALVISVLFAACM